MKIRVFRKGNKYKKRFSLDTEDWVTLLVVVVTVVFVLIQILLRGK